MAQAGEEKTSDSNQNDDVAARTKCYRRYYTNDDLCIHNSAEDCWVSIYNQVYDLTDLISENRGPLAQPIIEAAGQDISHWFTKDMEVKTYVDPETNLNKAFTPNGRFIHVPPLFPTTKWRTDFGTPWWKDEKYKIGQLTKKTRQIRLMNVLTKQETTLTVCSEETLMEIRDRYLEYNAHAASYTWKRLENTDFVSIDMEKTLAENGIEDESIEFEKLGINDDYYIPVIQLYFNDDLTIA
mmetsp:Transcript_46650/g.68205  ORF Transcript_46650/g.68205 Transcript_46650/m.68205 type:complete len:240 (+) Transcript_46650:105-824(+)|eukprot:CAMPEP_0194579108 /NCGR_PEP_ID=MMETSP0292-20121207/13283_1 /TAXON_ID=39354 /ORGANISM="Heterosigma akashiwo, Strain CCMP2393" /LENGTH=239 /DNA_ID=CAMNT_0039431947 /DNA_START=51 /DNA_END=770 /DNA_ORIENTATION=-